MLRRNIRLKKEYIFEKSQEIKQREQQETRIKMKQAVENEGSMPNNVIRNEKDKAIRNMELANDHTLAARTNIDDEYEMAKYRDPKLLVTTSREPS